LDDDTEDDESAFEKRAVETPTIPTLVFCCRCRCRRRSWWVGEILGGLNDSEISTIISSWKKIPKI
jgi:hypothetical protein